MTTGDANKIFRLDNWLVQPDLNRLVDGNRVVTLEPRVMGVLVRLASRPGKLVSADELLDSVWNGRAHADNTIYQTVTDLRKSLGDDARQPRYIETIPKKGYRLICPVTPDAADSECSDIVVDTPTGWRRKGPVLAISAVVASIAVALFLMAKPEFRNWLMPTDEGPGDRSVAVLPFVDMSEDGNQQYLADGVAEELIHVLSNLPDLRVTARTSSFAFRDIDEDIRQIGSQLNVATILEGSIRKDGDRLRVTSQLVDTNNGYHLWSKTFDRHFSDLFRIQNEIAVAVAKAFEYRELDALATDDPATRPAELQTDDLYLLGMHQLNKSTPSGDILATQHFKRAVEMDPSSARAYAGLSKSYANLYSHERDQELLDKAESAAEYALLLDDQSAEAFVALGVVKGATGDFSGAEAAYGKAVELNPNDAHANLMLAAHIFSWGRQEEGFELVKKALELYPMSGPLNNWMGWYHNLGPHRDWDMAYEYFRRAIDLDPDIPKPYRDIGLNYVSIGQLDQAIPYISKVVDLTTGPTMAGEYIGFLAQIYVDIGDYTSAAEVIRRAKELEPAHRGVINSEIHLQLARRDFSAVRDIVHSLLPTYVDNDGLISQLAFYEMLIGDNNHAQEIYARLAVAQEPSGIYDQVQLYNDGTLAWGMMGAVNLAYLHVSNGDTGAARELLVTARKYIESRDDHLWLRSGPPYVLAQIAAVEGNYDAAIDYFRKAVDGGWRKSWFGRIDPIMADLRKYPRFMQILEELEEKLLEMREHPRMMASNEP